MLCMQNCLHFGTPTSTGTSPFLFLGGASKVLSKFGGIKVFDLLPGNIPVAEAIPDAVWFLFRG